MWQMSGTWNAGDQCPLKCENEGIRGSQASSEDECVSDAGSLGGDDDHKRRRCCVDVDSHGEAVNAKPCSQATSQRMFERTVFLRSS